MNNKYSGFLLDNSMPDESRMEYYEDLHGATPVKHVPPISPTSQVRPQNGSSYGFANVVIYEPMNPEDVEMLIDFLRSKEPAIVKLNSQRTEIAQRILDMVSGAIFALNGSIHAIVDNVFLLTPEGVEISAPVRK